MSFSKTGPVRINSRTGVKLGTFLKMVHYNNAESENHSFTL